MLYGGKNSGETKHLIGEIQRLRLENQRLSATLTARENELRKLRVWLANTGAEGRETAVSEREQRLLAGLKTLAGAAEDMVMKSLNFSEQLKPKLDALPLSSADRVRLVMGLEELERSAAAVNSAAGISRESGKNFRSARVVAVRPELGMAVISLGSLHGIFPGMIFGTSDGKIKLRVAETRPQVSGVTAVQGTLDLLVPGSRVQLQMSKVSTEDKMLRRMERP